MSSSKSGEKSAEDQHEWREYNWEEEGGWWTCDLLNSIFFKFRGEKGEELQRTDRWYCDDDLENEKHRLVRSVLQIAKALRETRDFTCERQETRALRETRDKGLSDFGIVAKILQNSDNPVPVLENLVMPSRDIETLRPFLDAAMAGKLIELKSLELTRISLKATPIGSLPCGEYLAKVVGSGKLPNLARFKVNTCVCESNEVKLLFDSLKAIGGSLRELILRNNHIETQCHLALAKVIQSGHLLHLENLSLICTEMTSAALAAYSKGLVHLPALKELDFSRNWKLEALGHVALAEAMDSGHLPALERLNLTSTNMDKRACSVYAKAFRSRRLPALTKIDFRKNKELRDEGAKALSLAFASGHMGKMQSVCLQHCFIGNVGMEAICRAMGEGNLGELRDLDLSWNGLGDEGAKALSLAFASGHMDKMQYVNLGNCFTFSGVVGLEAICQAVGEGGLRELRVLDLSGRNWSRKCSVYLGSAIASRRLDSLLDLCLPFWYYGYDEEIFLPILSAIYQNLSFIARTSALDFAGMPDMDSDMNSHLYALRDRNLKHVQIMKDLGDLDKNIPVPLVPAMHAKIYLCGNPEAGKTTLCRSLLRSWQKSFFMWEKRPHQEERTRGIAVSQLESEGKDGMSFSLWDMAGQSEYHVVHHAFLRDLASSDGKRTFFIIVCRSQDEIKNVEDELEYWLQFIASGCRKDVQTPRSAFVVLNRDQGDSRVLEQSNMNRWKLYLDHMKEKFDGYVNIMYADYQNSFVMDVRMRQSVLPLKKCVIKESKRMVTYIPEICQQIQIEVNLWKTKMQFPVLHWDEFFKKVKEIEPEWMEKTVDAATRCLNEAGLILYINKKFPADWRIPHTRMVILDPNWICAEVVGRIFVPENLKKKFRSQELKVNPYSGAVSIKELNNFFKIENIAWQDSQFQDVIVILLWLGLCFKGKEGTIQAKEGYLFIPCLIETDVGPISLAQLHHTDDQWVMGYSVEYKESDIGLAPIALWHSLQVLLAQTIEYNGKDLGNDFTLRKHSVSFKCKQMVVLIQVNVSNNHPTFSSIDFFVKPIDRDAETTKQSQVALAYKLVQILCKLWGEVCPGIGHVKKVVWPWPALHPKPDFTNSEIKNKCWEVSRIKMKVLEDGMGMIMPSRVGDMPSGKITYDQLLCGEDLEDVFRSRKGERQNKVLAWNRAVEEGMKLGLFPDDMLM